MKVTDWKMRWKEIESLELKVQENGIEVEIEVKQEISNPKSIVRKIKRKVEEKVRD